MAIITNMVRVRDSGSRSKAVRAADSRVARVGAVSKVVDSKAAVKAREMVRAGTARTHRLLLSETDADRSDL